MIKNYVEVPSKKENDINPDATEWFDGKCIAIDEGPFKTIYIAHSNEVSTDENGNSITITRAFPIRVEKPVTRSGLINAAEMSAYGLTSAMDVASFNASLARKSRENETSDEVKEHDEFISWVKEELTKIGIK